MGNIQTETDIGTDGQTKRQADRQKDRQTGRGRLWWDSESRAGMQKKEGGRGGVRVSQDRLGNKSKIKRKRR